MQAVDPDREEAQGVQVGRLRTLGVGVRLEDDRIVVDEPRTAGDEEGRTKGIARVWNGVRTGGEVRQQPSLAARQIEHRDLDCLLAIGRGSEIREGDVPAVQC
ncbi:MAG TPA: hypothetical protein VKH82_01700 [Candidatus Binatia bacterium]|nr:hypothetical protein [Candidatus Binatia bacterium]